MQVRMKTRLAAPGLNLRPGQEVDLPAGLAQMLIEGGYAEAMDPRFHEDDDRVHGDDVETAEKRPAERAVGSRVRGRR